MFLILALSVKCQVAKDFSFTDTHGVTHHLYDDYLDQGKAVLVEFFFVDCPPCNSFAPTLQSLYEAWGEGTQNVEFFTLSSKDWDSNMDVEGYEIQHGLTNPGAGEDGNAFYVYMLYKNGGYGPLLGSPFFMVIAPDGNVQWDVDGIGNAGRYAALDEALTIATTMPVDTTDTGGGGDTTTVAPLPDSIQINLQIRDTKNNPVAGVKAYLVDGPQNSGGVELTVNNGNLEFVDFSLEFPQVTNPHIRFEKNDDWKNGVSALDMLAISRHILFINRFDREYQNIAADVNRDSKISAADIVDIRKIILEINTQFPAGVSWEIEPPIIPIDMSEGAPDQQYDIRVVKIGDVNRH